MTNHHHQAVVDLQHSTDARDHEGYMAYVASAQVHATLAMAMEIAALRTALVGAKLPVSGVLHAVVEAVQDVADAVDAIGPDETVDVDEVSGELEASLPVVEGEDTEDSAFAALLLDVAAGVRSGLTGRLDVGSSGIQVFGCDATGWLDWCARYGATTARVQKASKGEALHFWVDFDFARRSHRLSTVLNPSDAMPLGDAVPLADIRAALLGGGDLMTESIVIDHHRAMDLLRELVEANPDYVDRGLDTLSRYAPQGDYPGCLVGQALLATGVPVNALKAMDDAEDAIEINAVGLPPGVRITGHARDVLYAAQKAQDQGKPWRKALERATDVYESVRGGA